MLFNGDLLRAADNFARQAEIIEIQSELLLDDKILNIEILQKKAPQAYMTCDAQALQLM